MLTAKEIREARDWLEQQRAVVHPGPIETIRTALAYADVEARKTPRRSHGGFDCNNTESPSGDSSPF